MTTRIENEFGNTLYRCTSDMLAGIAYEFWTAQGLNSPAQIDAMIADGASAEDAADECINGWGLDQEYEDTDEDADTRSHMDFNGYTRESLIAAMREFMESRPDREVA